MSDTHFHWWFMWRDVDGRTWVHDPREMGRSDSPTDARRQHKMACQFGWVKEGMFDASVSDLFVSVAGGKQTAVQDGANLDDLVKNESFRAPVSAYEERLMS
jgi:hypothetical protein